MRHVVISATVDSDMPNQKVLIHRSYNNVFNLLLVTYILSKDKNLRHLTPFICSRTSKEALNYPTRQISRLNNILNYLQYMQFLKIE